MIICETINFDPNNCYLGSLLSKLSNAFCRIENYENAINLSEKAIFIYKSQQDDNYYTKLIIETNENSKYMLLRNHAIECSINKNVENLADLSAI